MARRPEHDGIAGGAPGAGVAGPVFLADVGFHLHDAPGQALPVKLADEDAAQQIAGDGQGRAVVEGARQDGHGEDCSTG